MENDRWNVRRNDRWRWLSGPWDRFNDRWSYYRVEGCGPNTSAETPDMRVCRHKCRHVVGTRGADVCTGLLDIAPLQPLNELHGSMHGSAILHELPD